MRVLVVHNRYRQRGGEDAVVDAEVQLMRDAGWDVLTYERDNTELDSIGRAGSALQAVWSRRTVRELRALLRRSPRDVVHVHNTVSLLSSSALVAARRSGAAVVQTLHNFRPVCVNGLLLRDDAPCTSCVGRRVALQGVTRGCWRSSRVQSAVLTAAFGAHRARGTFRTAVDLYVTPTAFDRDVFLRSGFTDVPIHVKPHFIADPPAAASGPGDYLLFVGRLAPEKGIDVLVDAWSRLAAPIPLRIAGDGPLRSQVEELAARSDGMVQWLGLRPRTEVLGLMRDARALVVPSRFYETFCLTAVEAAATARPAIVTGHGSLAEVVEDGRTGWHVPLGDAGALAAAMDDAWARPAASQRRGHHARARFDERWRAEQNLDQLRELYELARARAEVRR